MPIRPASSPSTTPLPRSVPASTTTASTQTASAPASSASTSDPVDAVEIVTDGTPTLAAPGEGRGGLPATLLETGNARVVHGDDPGDFYCEHAFFTAQQAADVPGSQVAKNAQGERLVGFLHVPRDDAAGDETPTADQAARHTGTREVVGAALRGFVEEAGPAAGRGPVRVLLTGYEQWGSVKNNPTADFANHRENVDAAMREAFGPNLVSSKGTRVGGDAWADVWSYRIQDPATGRRREVQIESRRLPVDDGAIDGGPRSLQTAMRAFQPHAVLSMGVHGGSSFVAEHHADDANLVVVDGRQQRSEQAGDPAARVNLPDNFALPRAIHRGAQPRPVGLADVGDGSVDRSLQAVAARPGNRTT